MKLPLYSPAIYRTLSQAAYHFKFYVVGITFSLLTLLATKFLKIRYSISEIFNPSNQDSHF